MFTGFCNLTIDIPHLCMIIYNQRIKFYKSFGGFAFKGVYQ